jgi:hypothetical protein
MVNLLHGTLAGLHRRGSPVDVATFCRWAAEQGWPDDELPVLRGVALAAANATKDLGELTMSRAADGSLVVQLTRDEARTAHGALREILLGPHKIREREFHSLMGYRRDEARVAFDALRDALVADPD